MMTRNWCVGVALAWTAAAWAQPQGTAADPGEGVSAPPAQPAASAADAGLLSEGEVRRINRETGKLTLRHGPLTNLDMPAMTMVFATRDARLLEGLKEGDKVRFTAERKDGAFVVTALRVVQPAAPQ